MINAASSAAANFGNIDLDDLNNANGYSANKAYGDAKLANILHAQELHRRYGAQGLNAVSLHPGNVATNFWLMTSSMTTWRDAVSSPDLAPLSGGGRAPPEAAP